MMSWSKIIQSAVTVAVSLSLGFSGNIISGLISGFIAGQIAGAIFMSAYAFSSEPISWKEVSYSEMKSAARHYKDFPRVNTLHAMLDALQNYGITFLLSLTFGNVVLGWYSFSYRILRAPLALIGSSFAQINYGAMSEMYNRKVSIRPVVVQTMKKIFLIGIPFFLTVAFFAPVIFKIIFGSEWEQAGVLAQIMSPWLFVNFIISTVSLVPNVLGEQKKAFIINLCGAIFSLLILGIGTMFYDTIHIPLLYFSLASALVQLCIGWWFLKIVKAGMQDSLT
jgi:O-antigen/teichoic acid export membrane protein